MKLKNFPRSMVNRSALVDALMDDHVSWREESAAVAESRYALR
jgi:hypothetical protein